MASSTKRNPETQGIPADLKPEQALGLVGLGMMQKLSKDNTRLRLVEDSDEKFDLQALHQRLELIALALETSAPLTTNEVAHLLGARPGSSKTERGGLSAKRISRNVWKLTRIEEKDSSYWRN